MDKFSLRRLALKQLIDNLGLGGQAEISRKTGIDASYVSRLLYPPEKAGARRMGEEIVEKITAVFPSWMDSTKLNQVPVTGRAPKEINLVNNPEYPAVRVVRLKANAGVQGYQVEQEVEDGTPIVFRRSWFDKHGYTPTSLMALKVAGQSMEPTFWEDDLIVINTDSKEPRDGHVYVVIYEGETGIKRLVRDDGQWWLVSDNHDTRRFPRKRCHESTEVIGEVVYKQSERF
jgi:phage repressor protein C with HTH and peptisase S24 domain